MTDPTDNEATTEEATEGEAAPRFLHLGVVLDVSDVPIADVEINVRAGADKEELVPLLPSWFVPLGAA